MNTLVPDRVTVTVDKGWITLHGEVDWDYQRRSAEKAMRNLMGVIGVSNPDHDQGAHRDAC